MQRRIFVVAGAVVAGLVLATTGCARTEISSSSIGSTDKVAVDAATQFLKDHSAPNLTKGWHRGVVVGATYKPNGNVTKWSGNVVVDNAAKPQELKAFNNATQAWLMATPGNYISFHTADSGEDEIDGIKELRVLEWGAVPSLVPTYAPTREQVAGAVSFLKSTAAKPSKGFDPVIVVDTEVGFSNGRDKVVVVVRPNSSLGTAFTNRDDVAALFKPGNYLGLKNHWTGKTTMDEVQEIQPAAVKMGR